jgi:hypothetical protein
MKRKKDLGSVSSHGIIIGTELMPLSILNSKQM